MIPRLASLLAVLASTSLTSAHHVESPLPGHTLLQQTWTVPITPGGPTVTLNGTVQQLFAQLTKLNPNYEAEFPALTPDTGRPRPDSDTDTNKKRDLGDHRMGRYSCGADFYDVGLGSVTNMHVEGNLIDHVDRVDGQPTLAPMACSRISCEWDTGIWWCNHLTTEKTLENWHVLADAVREVIKLCRKGGKGGGTGQIEFQDGWSILYRRAEEGTLC